MIATFLFAAAVAAANPCKGVKNPPLCRDLLDIYDRDQAARGKDVKAKDAQKIDTSNVARVQSIVNQFGWPTKSLVGEQASFAAWTVVQHADLETQKFDLDLMAKAADAKQFSSSLVAKLTDRIAIREGKAQVYGTEAKAPIDDEAHVDERRAKMGLAPLKRD